MNYQLLPLGDVEKFNVIIENPRGYQNKYEYSDALDVFVLERVFKNGLSFVADYGFIPKTKGEDNDPLDVFVITPTPLNQGSIVQCRAIGMIELIDNGERDNKIIAVPFLGSLYESENIIDDDLKQKFTNFFVELARQKNVVMTIKSWCTADVAKSEINKYME